MYYMLRNEHQLWSNRLTLLSHFFTESLEIHTQLMLNVLQLKISLVAWRMHTILLRQVLWCDQQTRQAVKQKGSSLPESLLVVS